jgi:hypothetical protein
MMCFEPAKCKNLIEFDESSKRLPVWMLEVSPADSDDMLQPIVSTESLRTVSGTSSVTEGSSDISVVPIAPLVVSRADDSPCIGVFIASFVPI